MQEHALDMRDSLTGDGSSPGLELNDEVAVLEVLKTFGQLMSPATIAEHLVAVEWVFRDECPLTAVNTALEKMLEKGQVRLDGEFYWLAVD